MVVSPEKARASRGLFFAHLSGFPARMSLSVIFLRLAQKQFQTL
jgi:hypothetical protein